MILRLPALVMMMMGFGSVASAQFSDSVHYYMNYATTGSINRTDESSLYLLNNSTRFSVRKKRVLVDLNAAWIYGQQNNQLTNNDVNTGLNFNLYHSEQKQFYYWGLANYVSSYSLKINRQLQTGAGLAYSIVDREKVYINLSNGIIYEASSIVQPDSTEDVYNTFRNSFRLQYRFTVWERIVFNGSGFVQNSLQYKDDYILRFNTGLSLKLNSWLNLTTNFAYNSISRTGKENMLFVYGLRVEHYF